MSIDPRARTKVQKFLAQCQQFNEAAVFRYAEVVDVGGLVIDERWSAKAEEKVDQLA